MATMVVTDRSGAAQVVEKPLAPNRAAAAASRPVVLSNEDFAAIDGIETALAAANVLLTSISGFVDGIETLLGAATPAGENHIGSLGGNTFYVDVTLSLDTNIYASGDVLAETQVIANAMRAVGSTGVLQSITVIDQDDQKAALYLWFLSTNVSMGVENAQPSISDANALQILGPPVAFTTSDYFDLGGVSVAGRDGIGKVVKPDPASRDLYIAVVNGPGTPTYTASGVKLRLGFFLD